MKTKITEKQIEQFNRMYVTLKKISKAYMSPELLRRRCIKKYGLEFEEAIEMTYENIQADAHFAVKGVKIIRKPQNCHVTS